MTNFMTVILAQPTCPGDQRACHIRVSRQPVHLTNATVPDLLLCGKSVRYFMKGIQFQFPCNLCWERHKTQVWLCVFALSFLSTYTFAASVPRTADVKICLEMLKHVIEMSDAMLYAPSINDINRNCEIMSLRCYMLELIMVIDEEEIMDNQADCIIDFHESLPPEANSVGCPPCEAYSLKNITIFLERLNNLLTKMTAEQG